MIVTDKRLLTSVCDLVESQKEADEISKELKSVLKKNEHGIGLAAPQIGINKQVCVIKTYENIKTLVNPLIINKENLFIYKNEGCLSFPGVWLNTIRYMNIEVSSQFSEQNFKFNNIASVVAQHEIDHLCGILFFDRQVPKKYDECVCGSGDKFKFCCFKQLKNDQKETRL